MWCAFCLLECCVCLLGVYVREYCIYVGGSWCFWKSTFCIFVALCQICFPVICTCSPVLLNLYFCFVLMVVIIDMLQVDTAGARLGCYCIQNRIQYTLYLTLLPDFPFLGKPVMHIRWMAVMYVPKTGCYCIDNRCIVSCIISTGYSAVCIYQIGHKLCQPGGRIGLLPKHRWSG